MGETLSKTFVSSVVMWASMFICRRRISKESHFVLSWMTHFSLELLVYLRDLRYFSVLVKLVKRYKSSNILLVTACFVKRYIVSSSASSVRCTPSWPQRNLHDFSSPSISCAFSLVTWPNTYTLSRILFRMSNQFVSVKSGVPESAHRKQNNTRAWSSDREENWSEK
jgi:hypothetical protein